MSPSPHPQMLTTRLERSRGPTGKSMAVPNLRQVPLGGEENTVETLSQAGTHIHAGRKTGALAFPGDLQIAHHPRCYFEQPS